MANAVYDKLAERIGAAGYPSYIRILENQLTPEETEIILDLADGTPAEEVARKHNMAEDKFTATLNGLMGKRVILKGKGGYVIPRSPRFFPRGPDNEKTRELWTEFFRTGGYQEILVGGWKVRRANGAPQSHKIIPARQALDASPNIKPDQILWYEDMHAIFRRSKALWQGGLKDDGTLGQKREGGCGCRTVWDDACDAIGGCTGWEWKDNEWPTDETLKNAEAKPFRPGRREITPEEAIAASLKMEDAGQIHISPNTAQITGTCNCCSCCCVIMQPMKNHGDIYTMLAPSRFRAVIDEAKCSGCQTCVERCHYEAIEMRKAPNSKKMKAYIINEHCMGCGLCVFKCESNAISFELIRPAEHIPTGPWISPATADGAKVRTPGVPDGAPKGM